MNKPSDLKKAHYVLDPGVEDGLALRLARAYDSAALVTSWASQERAQDFVNSHDIEQVFAEIEAREGTA